VGSITEKSNSQGLPQEPVLARTFTAETPLHPAATQFLEDAFASGWANPTKIHHASRKTGILIAEAKNTFCTLLGLAENELFFLGDTPLGFHLGITGFAGASGGTVFYPATARSMAYAVAEALPNQKLEVDEFGHIGEVQGSEADLLVWQAVNAETGVRGVSPAGFRGKIFVDAVNSFGPISAAPTFHETAGSGEAVPWSAAIWDSRAWSGPAGFSIFALKDRASWRNPLPHNDNKPTSGNISIPLMIASAIALENYVKDFEANRNKLSQLNEQIRTFITNQFPGSHVAGNISEVEPHLISMTLAHMESSWLVNQLDRIGFAIDTGSACMSMNMQPSHVLAAMGLPVTGNIRLRLRPDHTESDVENLLSAIASVSETFAD